MDHTQARTPSPASETSETHRRSTSPVIRAKIDRIRKACEEGPDVEALIDLATSKDGLVDDEVRRKVCMFAAWQGTPHNEYSSDQQGLLF